MSQGRSAQGLRPATAAASRRPLRFVLPALQLGHVAPAVSTAEEPHMAAVSVLQGAFATYLSATRCGSSVCAGAFGASGRCQPSRLLRYCTTASESPRSITSIAMCVIGVRLISTTGVVGGRCVSKSDTGATLSDVPITRMRSTSSRSWKTQRSNSSGSSGKHT